MRAATVALAALAVLATSARGLLRSNPRQDFPEVVSVKDFQKIANHAGVYLDKKAHPEFARTVLVTASNSAYSKLLKNWRCKADKLGLDYIVISLDEGLQREVGPEHGILSDGAHFTGEQHFRRDHFNEMSCMKLMIVKEITRAGYDVVFSDPDNVFGADPFAHGVSLGDKMRSGNFDYVYQQNHGRLSLPNESSLGAEVEEGNTGFYYVRGSAKQRGMQAMFAAALTECDRHRNMDDQSNFWLALRTVRNQSKSVQPYGEDTFACANLCLKGSTCQAKQKDVLSYCEMDPFQHATGWELGIAGRQRAVTYHANFVGSGIPAKIGKLARNGFWDWACAGAPVV